MGNSISQDKKRGKRVENWTEDARSRLRDAINHHSSQSSVALTAGLNRATINALLKEGGARPGEETLALICAAIGVPVNAILQPVPSANSGLSKRAGQTFIPFDHEVEASAGPGRVPDEMGEEIEELGFPAKWVREQLGDPARLRAVTINGDSMEPTLGDGGIAIYYRSTRDRGDGIYVFRLGEQLHIKRLLFKGSVVTVHSDNAAYPPWDVSAAEVAIIGKVVWSGRGL